MSLEDLNDNGFCFACGRKNEYGLGMRVEYQGERALCRISLPSRFQGWDDRAHGGVISTMLDEIMAYAVLKFARPGVTVSMETRFKAPTPLGEPLLVTGWIDEQKSRMAIAKGTVALADRGKVLAESVGRFLLQSGK